MLYGHTQSLSHTHTHVHAHRQFSQFFFSLSCALQTLSSAAGMLFLILPLSWMPGVNPASHNGFSFQETAWLKMPSSLMPAED